MDKRTRLAVWRPTNSVLSPAFFRFLYVCGRLILFPSFKVEKKKNFQQEVATSAK